MQNESEAGELTYWYEERQYTKLEYIIKAIEDNLDDIRKARRNNLKDHMRAVQFEIIKAIDEYLFGFYILDFCSIQLGLTRIYIGQSICIFYKDEFMVEYFYQPSLKAKTSKTYKELKKGYKP